ncbi:hypothetical protein J4Q44_G00322920 [Coregonus suidteri]|uniref:Uncharacterized protein n=1 Tax=Coregonus suidteri TaxID=861788 RepID=A0AAN8QAL2_9TELE
MLSVARLTLRRTCPSVWESTRACCSKPACRKTKEKDLSATTDGDPFSFKTEHIYNK